jgi:hypothetical protein
MRPTIYSGVALGTGAAINVELGFIPDRVEIVNGTDGDKIHVGFPNRIIIPFTSGGTTEIVAGHVLVGATTGAKARVAEVKLASGTWAAGDAAGVFVLYQEDRINLTDFGSENVDVQTLAGYSIGSNLATVTANVTHTVDIDTEVAGATGNNAVSAYRGASGSNSKGFTIGSTISEAGKVLHWTAERFG